MWRQWFRRPVVGGIEARQGFLDRPVLVVLIVSIVLAGILLAFVWPALT
jgi:hypothetical protein